MSAHIITVTVPIYCLVYKINVSTCMYSVGDYTFLVLVGTAFKSF